MTLNNYKIAISLGKGAFKVRCKNGRIVYTISVSKSQCESRFTGSFYVKPISNKEFLKHKIRYGLLTNI